MENYSVSEIDESFNTRMLPILESSPIYAGGLSLYFDKSPDIFHIPHLKYTSGRHLGFFLGTELKGFASLGYYNAWVGGQEEKVFTFYNFYITPEARGNHLASMAMQDFFKHAQARANFGIALSIKGNHPVESYVGQQICDGSPPSRILDEWVVKSILISFPIKNKTNYTIRNARIDDIPVIVALLNKEHRQRDFGLCFSEDDFQSNLNKRGLVIEDYYVAMNWKGEVKGVCLAWDASSFRKTRVLLYSPGFYPLLLAYKAMAQVFKMAAFPAKGESFSELTITDYAVEDRDRVIMHALLSEIYYRHHNGKYHFMNFGSCSSDKLLSAAVGFWHKEIVSNILFTSFDTKRFNTQANLPYIDIAFL